MAATIVTGAAFGAALASSGVYMPSVILGQLKWENYHMLQAFLSATAASSVVNYTSGLLGHTSFTPLSYSDRGWFAPYDGNIVGGLLLGTGMALSGACPGTVLAQTAIGIRTGYFALGGALAGGYIWAAVLRPTIEARKEQTAQTEKRERREKTDTAALPTGLPALLGVSNGTAVVLFEAAMIAIIATAAVVFGADKQAALPPVLGGLFIGLAQLVSVVLRRSTLGMSGAYESMGDLFSQAVEGGQSRQSSKSSKSSRRINYQNILLALSVMAGARAAALFLPAVAASARQTSSSITPAMAALGGFAMVVGARTAGGCPSGHGISGMSRLSLPSFITIAATFLGGGIAALFL